MHQSKVCSVSRVLQVQEVGAKLLRGELSFVGDGPTAQTADVHAHVPLTLLCNGAKVFFNVFSDFKQLPLKSLSSFNASVTAIDERKK